MAIERAPRRSSVAAPGRHVPALDGVRGVAILLVMLFHFAYMGGVPPATALDLWALRLLRSAWCGVDLFFVLSGFLITGILVDTRDSAGCLRTFYARRFLRIFPLYYAALALFLFALPILLPGPNQLSELRSEQVWYWTYLLNIRIALESWPSYGALGHFWSLAVEEQFYLVWPFVLVWAPRGRLPWLCLATVAAAIALRVVLVSLGALDAAYVLTPTRMDAFGIGGLVAVLARDEAGRRRLASALRPALGASAAALVALGLWRGGLRGEDPIVTAFGLSLLAVLGASAIAAICVTGPQHIAHRLFDRSGLRFFGRYSYALYVFHHPVTLFATERGLRADLVEPIAGSQLPGLLVVALVCGGVSVALALISWWCWESRFLALKDLFPSAPPVRAQESATGGSATGGSRGIGSSHGSPSPPGSGEP
jgi:peptidoglycan/LPS O-acetylase OafA/YrhL